MREILSVVNPNIKKVIKLRNRRFRDETKLFLIEGYRELVKAINKDVQFDSLFICEDFFLKDNEENLIKKIEEKKITIFKCSEKVFQKISYRDRPDGLLAIAYQDQKGKEAFEIFVKNKENLFLVVLEGIEKPGNLGTILRSCDGAKVDAVIICDPCTDIYNPNVVRASIGSLFTTPVFICNSENAIDILKKNKIKILATTPHASDIYYEENLKGSIAIVAGCEQYGLSDIWLKKADVCIKIPMKGESDSLNVATSTTIIVYEAIRQRS